MGQIWQEIKDAWQNVFTVIKTNWKKIILLIIASIGLSISNFNLRNFTNNVISYIKNNSGKTIIIIIVLGILSLVAISLFRFGTVLAFLFIFPLAIDTVVGDWVFPVITNRLTGEIAVNIWVARAIATIISIIIIYAIYLIMSWGRDSGRKRIMGISIIVIGFIIYALGMFFVTKDNNFNTDGTPTKCFAFTPQGMEEVSCAYKVHPIYGTAVQPISKEILLTEQTRTNGLPQMSVIRPNKNTCFFAPDGTPLVWYHERDNGQIDFFDRPGNHPQLNTVLTPINPAIVSKFFQYIDAGKKDMVNTENGGKSGLEDLRDFLSSMQQ